MADILVAGGGIGGLAAALGLARHGHRITVLERRELFAEVGAGIQLGPNAFAALDLLGVGEEVRRRAVHIGELRFMDGTTGARVAALPLTGAYRARFGNPYAVVHRADLYVPLLDACRREPAVRLRGRRHVVGYEQRGGRVRALLADGGHVTGDALIGADGLHSAIRAQLVGDGTPRMSGHTVHRAVIPMAEVPEELRWNAVTLWAGPRWHFVHYPIAGGTHLNLAATLDNGATEAVAGVPVDRADVLASFPRLSGPARRLLELGRDWKAWTQCDRDPVDRWTDGRVTLLGDAAHPMLQYAAQGACQALEDAVLLGELLDGCPADYEQRLEKYGALRRERTARVQSVSRHLGRHVYHAAGEARVERNAMLSSLTADDLHDQLAWLHGVTGFGQGARR
ncbi:3-hydroxybenzoate 6-monooxygenase [Streptomyces beihaiensis]|uniref:3-hydroxybenzoate 6-monooxygenase n=1 Tax=Streptomyces beihaiensis TaxID=2984495 RepID=A0ABT3TT37_9ACTN|nr:3-hydroxybenzoate 6-monooxygenase [Streptomyces beihaiensis]MCX3059245.1 3-hydroxybenzoate 6-monooxygenase [Streptomyces beihaiensis]